MTNITTQLVQGNFSSISNAFSQAQFLVNQAYPGVLQITKDNNRPRVLISVGIHGDETAPIDMMASLLEQLSYTPNELAVDLMIVVGNLQAIAEQKRFIDVDLNRLFKPNRTAFNNTKEAQRADQLMHATTSFFAGHQNNIHLDLHTAIRASVYSTFAIVPGKTNPHFVRWLGAAGIAAVVLSPQPSVTFSSYTCAQHGALSCTAELGRIGKLGQNDLTPFAETKNAIATLLRTGAMHQQAEPILFRIAQELIKHSDAFQFTFDSSTKNFTAFPPGAILATDGEVTYSAGATPEFVLFPNPDVHIGLRAGLMVVTDSISGYPQYGR